MTNSESYFSLPDYAVFENRLAMNAEYDGERERVRNKLVSLHKAIYPEIRKRRWDLHPHWMPQWLISASRISPATARIEFMTLRYSKPETTIKLMKKQLIEDFGHFYANAMLAARIDREGFAIELFISEKAWVDGQNLKNRLRDGTLQRGHFRSLLAELGGEHALRLSQFVRGEERPIGYQEIVRAKASRLVNVGMLNSTMEKYKPGGHELRLGIAYKPDDARLTADNIASEILTRLEQLYPIYAFLSWSPKNDYRKTKDADHRGDLGQKSTRRAG
ncbi:MAG: hypothetical protein KGJ80_11170 [Chloroflexota bacterium]|nr:hypothetical protein [Chloroflexota bacterium]